MVPFVLKTAFFPFIMAMLLAVFIYAPHRIGKIMYWFQTEENKVLAGELTMAAFSMVAGTTLGTTGVLAGTTISIVEHFEFPPIRQ